MMLLHVVHQDNKENDKQDKARNNFHQDCVNKREAVECKREKEEGGDDVKYWEPLVLHGLLSKLDCHKEWESQPRHNEEQDDSEEIEEGVTERESEGRVGVDHGKGEGSDQGGGGSAKITSQRNRVGSV